MGLSSFIVPQYFHKEHEKSYSLLEMAVKYGQAHQQSINSAQVSMFGGEDNAVEMPEPIPPKCPEWGTLEKLNRERDVIWNILIRTPAR